MGIVFAWQTQTQTLGLPGGIQHQGGYNGPKTLSLRL